MKFKSKIKYIQNIKKYHCEELSPLTALSVIFSSRATKEYLYLTNLTLNLVQYLVSDKDQSISKNDVGP